MDVGKTVYRIIEDLRDRRGLGDEWDQIDADIQEGIYEEWCNIVKEALAEEVQDGHSDA